MRYLSLKSWGNEKGILFKLESTIFEFFLFFRDEMKRVTANSTVSSQNQNDLFVINTVDNRQNLPKNDFTKSDQIKGIARVVAHYNDNPSTQQESSSSMSSTISASILTQELLSLVQKPFFSFKNRRK